MADDVAQWDDFDHLAVGAMEDPGPLLKELREQCPVGHSQKHGGFWVIADYEGAVAAARATRVFSSSSERGPGAGFPFSYPIRIPMINDDPPIQRDFRQPLQATFSARSAEAMAPKIREICLELIDDFIESGEADLALDLTMGVPALVIGELLDLPPERRTEFHGWAQDVVATGGDTPSFASLVAFVEELYDARRLAPGGDIPSTMLAWQIAGRPISKEEWLGMVLLLILAGLDTTSNGGALLFDFLGARPDIRAYLLEDRSRIPAVIEEAMRYLAPVPQHSRGLQEDVEISGQHIKAGDVAVIHWLSANRDPGEFPDPDTFVPGRTPNRHLGFGSGPHRCLGLHLARVELREVVDEVLTRLPDYEVVETVRYPGLNRGVSSLKVRFPPGKRTVR